MTNQQMAVRPAKRSVWASAQSDQSLRCQHEEILGPYLTKLKYDKTSLFYNNNMSVFNSDHIFS